MQFKHKQNIDAPASYVFARLTDFNRFENDAKDMRFSFKRQHRRPIQIGTKWNITAHIRGRDRKFVAELTELIPPRTVSYRSGNAKYEAVLSVTVTSIDAEKCRVDMLLIGRSKAFSTALVFNSIRVGRKRITKRLQAETEKYAEHLAAKYREG